MATLEERVDALEIRMTAAEVKITEPPIVGIGTTFEYAGPGIDPDAVDVEAIIALGGAFVQAVTVTTQPKIKVTVAIADTATAADISAIKTTLEPILGAPSAVVTDTI